MEENDSSSSRWSSLRRIIKTLTIKVEIDYLVLSPAVLTTIISKVNNLRTTEKKKKTTWHFFFFPFELTVRFSLGL